MTFSHSAWTALSMWRCTKFACESMRTKFSAVTDRGPKPILCLVIPCSLFTLLNFCVFILSLTLRLMHFLVLTLRQNFSDGPADPESDWTCA